jgi:NitT/TauT family transport system substrate-binding protein
MCLQHDLRLAGMDPSALARVADHTMADNLAALRAGTLDVVQLFEPLVAQALQGGFGKVVYAASARGPCVYTSFIATRATVAAKPDACTAVVRATAAMQQWLAAQGGKALASAVASYFPDVAPDLLADGLRRYHEAGLWSATPAMSRGGFARLGESFVSGGALRQPPSYEACVLEPASAAKAR